MNTPPLKPTVAVVITYYRNEAYVAEAVASVLNQSRPADEIVLIDDASPEGSPAVDIRIRVTRHAENRGPGAARQTGVDATTSDWIAFLDADDVWLPEKLACQLADIAERPELDVHHTGLVTCYSDGRRVAHVGKPHLLTLAQQLRRNQALPSATMMRRTALMAVGGWSSDRRRMEDWDLGIRLVAAGYRVGFLARGLVLFRRMAHGNLSSRGLRHMSSNLRTITGHFALYRRALGWLGTLAVAGRVTHDEGCRRGKLSGLALRAIGWVSAMGALP